MRNHYSRATLLIAVACFLAVGYARAQLRQTLLVQSLKPAIDSLQNRLEGQPQDTTRANTLNALSFYYLNYFLFYSRDPADSSRAARFAGQAEVLSRQLTFGNGLARSFLNKASLLLKAGKTEDAQRYLREASGIFQQTGDKQGQADALYLLACAVPYENWTYTTVLAELESARLLYQQAGDRKAEAQALQEIADVHVQQGKLPQALGELQEALGIQTAAGDYRHYTYDLMAHIYTVIGDYQKALRYALQSLQSAETHRDYKYIRTFYYRLGLVYDKVGSYKSSLHYYRRALAYYIKDKEDFLIIHTVHQICKVMLQQERPAQVLAYALKMIRQHPPAEDKSRREAAYLLATCYQANGQHDRAETHFAQYMALSVPYNGRPWDEMLLLKEAGTFYVVSLNYAKARVYLDKALQLSEGHGFLPDQRDVYLQLFKLDSLQANYKAAIGNYQQYKRLSDSLVNEAKSKQISTLQVQYDTQQKEQTLKLKEKDIRLLTKHNQLQQQEIEQARQLEYITVVGAVMLALLLGVIYNRYRLKQKSNRQLQVQQQKLQAQQDEIFQKNASLSQLVGEKDELLTEKEWLMKEIHHRVKNNLQIIMSLLGAQTEFLKDEAALAAIKESRHRVFVMALIHQKLYQSDNLARIKADSYVQEIADNLNYSFNTRGRIKFRLDIDPVELDVTQAVPVGLIINEAVTNALKYAFPENRPGTITLLLNQAEDENYRLTIADDGVGLPDSFNLACTASLGMSIMKGLSKQLGGRLDVESHAGVKISVLLTQIKPVARQLHPQ